MKTFDDYLEVVTKDKSVVSKISTAFHGTETDQEMETFELDPEPINPKKKKNKKFVVLRNMNEL